jgi:ABC-type multidrug transport system fused ATPase/permease subunit
LITGFDHLCTHEGFQIFDSAILVAVLWYGGHLVLSGRMTADGLISFLLYQLQLGENLYVSDIFPWQKYDAIDFFSEHWLRLDWIDAVSWRFAKSI